MSGSAAKQSQEETILTLLASNHSLQREIAALSKSCNEWRAIASGKAMENAALRAEITTLREAVREARVALAEIRTLLHCQGRRPEECYAMSVADDAIGAIRRALEEGNDGEM